MVPEEWQFWQPIPEDGVVLNDMYGTRLVQICEWLNENDIEFDFKVAMSEYSRLTPFLIIPDAEKRVLVKLVWG